jgi:hypothetical protein
VRLIKKGRGRARPDAALGGRGAYGRGRVRLSAIEQLGGGIVNGVVSWVPCYQKEGSSLAGMVGTRWCPRVHASVRQVSEGGGEG